MREISAAAAAAAAPAAPARGNRHANFPLL